MGLTPPPHFAYDFSRKIFFMLYPVIWTNFTIWLVLTIEKLGKVTIVIICIPICDVIDFEINISFLVKPFFTWPKKSGQLLIWNKKHFPSFLKGFLLKQIKATFLKGESLNLRKIFLISDQCCKLDRKHNCSSKHLKFSTSSNKKKYSRFLRRLHDNYSTTVTRIL